MKRPVTKPLRNIPPGGSISRGRPRSRRVKVWAFAEKPRFQRVDRMVGVARSREPHVDVFDDESEELVVVVQLPGVASDAYQLEIRGDTLVLTATAGDGPDTIEYWGEAVLPFPVQEEPISEDYQNYILEVRLRRDADGKTMPLGETGEEGG